MSGFRVVLDIDRIAADLCVAEERPVRAVEVRELLKRLGFIAIEAGDAWLATSSCLAVLRSHLGPHANPFKSPSQNRETETRQPTDDLSEVEAAWDKLPPAKRQEIMQTIRGS